MTEEPPQPPVDPPATLVDALEDCSSDHLRQIATYAEELADYRGRSSVVEENQEETAEEDPEATSRATQEERPNDLPGDRPDGVPSKAAITTKEINDNRYYYWQWRDGDRIQSKYEGPVDPDGSS
jgi:hypothetical protein